MSVMMEKPKQLLNLSTPSGLVEVYRPALEKVLEVGDISVSCEAYGSPASVTGKFRWVADEIETCLMADWGRYIHSGSSHLISTVIGFLKRTGRKKVLMSEFSHKSVFEAVADYGLRFGLVPAGYILEFDAVTPPALQQVEEALRRHRDADAVILTSPTYDLIEYDGAVVRKLADLIHGCGMVFIVDAAWAHPPSLSEILRNGADIVINSVHKMNGSFQGGSVIGVSLGGVLKEEELDTLTESWLRHLGTSPSFPILLSIGAALEVLRTEQHILELPREFTHKLRALLEKEGIKTLTEDDLPKEVRRGFRVDDWKLQVKVRNGYRVKKLCEEQFDLVLEKAGPNHVQLIATFREMLKARDVDGLTSAVCRTLAKTCLVTAT
jgi:arginine/lysine/ornithine decarboxylase